MVTLVNLEADQGTNPITKETGINGDTFDLVVRPGAPVVPSEMLSGLEHVFRRTGVRHVVAWLCSLFAGVGFSSLAVFFPVFASIIIFPRYPS